MPRYDVVIAGGGPAGLSAAIWLGRYGRTVRVYDAGPARNQPAWAVHGYPGIPEPSPSDLRRILRQQALDAGAECVGGEVITVTGSKGRFRVGSTDDEVAARRVVLAYGLRDYIPAIPGVEELYGSAVFHCPDCDGPTVAGRRVGVLGWNRYGAAQALYLRHFSDHIVLLGHGCPIDMPPRVRRALRRHGIPLREETVVRAVGGDGELTGVELDGGATLELDALFFHLGTEPRCPLAGDLGCDMDDDGYLSVDHGQETSLSGVHAAGDITGHPHLAAVAAAEGVRAALSIHRSLLPSTMQV